MFLRGLVEEKILASVCTRCDIAYLPPKIYCTNCFGEISEYKDVGRRGTITALTETYVEFDGSRLKEPKFVGFIGFVGVRGGLIHKVRGKKAKVGAKASAQFIPKGERTGAMTDIESFVVS